MVVGRAARFVTDHSRVVVAVLLVATLVVGSGAAAVEQSSSLDAFEANSTASQKQAYVDANFDTGPGNRTTVQVIYRGENVLSKDALLSSLRFQRSLRANETVNGTLAADRPTASVANLVAVAAIHREAAAAGQSPPAGMPTLDAQIDQLSSMDAAAVERTVESVLAEDGTAPGDADPLAMMPTTYEPGSASADATMILVVQETDGEIDGFSGASTELVDSQLAIRQMATDALGEESFVFGLGIVSDEIGRSMGDSFSIIGPLALLFVVVTLAFAYRDLLDVVLGVLGVVLVLVWMSGFMGWVGIPFNQMLIAVPILLIGLSIDYGIHVFMRHREVRERTGEESRPAMGRALSSVGVALVLVTATTAFGFLSNLSSTIPPIRDFGLVSAAGIVSALAVFGLLVPALKVEADDLLSRVGLDRQRRAFGTGGGLVSRALSTGVVAARRAPVAVLVASLLLAAGGAYGATQVDTSFDQQDFLAEDPPAWMDSLPEPFAPGEYTIRENVGYLDDHFLQMRDTTEAQILVEGDVTAPDALERVHDGREHLAAADTVVTLSDGSPRVDGPLATMERVAARNESFAATFAGADTDGDGVPDRDLAAVYDALYAAAPEEAAAVVHRTDDGEYRALRLVASVEGGATVKAVTEDAQGAADAISGGGLTATATGDPVLTRIVQRGLLETLTTTLALTLVSVSLLLVAFYWRREGAPLLGVVTLVPVVFALAWVLGTMYLLDIPFNSETAMITGLAIGLGVDYAIHMGERYEHELDRTGDVEEALSASVSGTGGALLGSAVTTTGGFGVLAVALVPSLQRFGVVIALAIAYAFVATVLVLPSALALWTRYAEPGR